MGPLDHQLQADGQLSAIGQVPLCERFLAAKIDWPAFTLKDSGSIHMREVPIRDLVCSRIADSDRIVRSADLDDIEGQKKFVARLLKCGDGKILSLATVICHFDTSQLIDRIRELQNRLPAQIVLSEPELSPDRPGFVAGHAEKILSLTVSTPDGYEAEKILDRARALRDISACIKNLRFASELIETVALGSTLNDAETGRLIKHLPASVKGLGLLAEYLREYHLERQVDLLASTFFSSDTPTPYGLHENVLDGVFARHIDSARLAITDVHHALQFFMRNVRFDSAPLDARGIPNLSESVINRTNSNPRIGS